jgi:hypothetical protein
MPPWRSTSRSSMESAPATMPPTIEVSFTAAFGEATVRWAPASSPRPHRSASRSTGASPAWAIRFRSDSDADTAVTA